MPLFDTSAAQAELPLFCEPAALFGQGLVMDGRGNPVMLTGREALALWVRKALDAESVRFAFAAHTDRYGNELQSLLGAGRDMAESRMREMIRSCLLANPYITGVDHFVFEHAGSGLHAGFSVSTRYGEMTAESEASYS